MCINSQFKGIFSKLATNDQNDMAFLLTLKFGPQGFVCPCPGIYTCGKNMKKRVAIVLKFAINGQSDKGFLLTSTFVPRGCLPLPWGYIHKSIKIYTRKRGQVSVYRTAGSLVMYWYNISLRPCL